MFYGTSYSLREMVLIWFIVTGIWAIALILALKAAQIKLTGFEKIVVIQLAGLALLFPVVGIFLAPVVAIYLIYRMSDAELPITIAAVLISRFLSAIIAILIERAFVYFGFLKG